MGRKKGPKEEVAPAAGEDQAEETRPEKTKSVKAGSGEVAMRAPKGTAAIGLPLDGDEVLQVKVPKNGIVRVSLETAGRLQQHGFTRVVEED